MRVDKLRQVILGNELDGMLISNPLSRRYLSGFSGTAGWLLVSADRAMLARDCRYYRPFWVREKDAHTSVFLF